MAIDEKYVDPSGGSDSTGDGTSGNPWKSVQKALDNTTLGTYGTRINVKGDGSASPPADPIAAALNLSGGFSGTTSATQPLVIQGYTSTAGDGGLGGIEGTTNSVGLFTAATVRVIWKDLVLVDGNSVTTAYGYDHTTGGGLVCINCKWAFNYGGMDLKSTSGAIINCHITTHNAGAGQVSGIDATSSFWIYGSYLEVKNQWKNYDHWIDIYNQGGFVHSVFKQSQATISSENYTVRAQHAFNCTFYSASSTPDGCDLQSFGLMVNCYFEGFDTAHDYDGYINPRYNNRYYNNSAHYSVTSGDTEICYDYNADTSASGLTNVGSGDFTPTSELKSLGVPLAFFQLSGTSDNDIDIGAVQAAGAAGGGMLTHPGMKGRING